MKYLDLVEIYEKLEGTSKRLEKTYHVSRLIAKTNSNELPKIMLLLEGKVFPQWDDRKLGVASRLVLKAINVATGISAVKVEQEWKRVGDLGKVTEKLIARKKQATLFSTSLTVAKVFNNLQKLATLEGQGTVDRKVQLIAELLTSAKPNEAKYITRTVLEDLRVGVGEGSVRDAILWAVFPLFKFIFFKCAKCDAVMPKIDKCLECGTKLEVKTPSALCKKEILIKELGDLDKLKMEKNAYLVFEDEGKAREAYNYMVSLLERAYSVKNDFSEVVIIARDKGVKGLKKADIKLMKPIKVMLYQKAKDMKEAFEKVGKPAAFEFKYDGFRMVVNKSGNKVRIFTRNLEDVTKQFPDVVEAVRENVKADSVILDGEAVGFDKKTTKYLPFQSVSQRIKRKYNINELAEKFPVEVNVFDVLFYNGEGVIGKSFNERRKILSDVVNVCPRKIVLSRIMITDNETEANKFYNEALDAGNEGVMVKNLEAEYKPGSRVGYGVKLKPVMESLDVVITGAEWGTGKRAHWLTSFDIACVNDGDFVDIGKVGTGIKELEGEGLTFNQLTEMLKPLVVEEKGKHVKVKPRIVIEVHYEEIQKSPTYSSGYALRFPRVTRLREDRSPQNASTLDLVEDFYDEQRGR